MIYLTDNLPPEHIRLSLAAETKEQAIAELVDLLADQRAIQDRDKALRAVLEREATRTTGIGNAMAIPHGKTAAAEKLVLALGRADKPIDFQSIDRRDVELIVLVISPFGQTGLHIQALARISRLLNQPKIRSDIAEARTPEAVHEAIRLREMSAV